ncbi:MAG: hypothetical protein U1D69_04790, partial [Polynucleobacter sp.]|nr:hypothetical protein [Polynucleobacter sp.]
SLAERPLESREHVDLAMRLSPLDPMHYAMVGTRAFTHMVQGEDAEAAEWADRAARAPGAHVLIAMIAAVAHALAGNSGQAERWVKNIQLRNTAMHSDDFFRAFPMQQPEVRNRIRQSLKSLGF